MNPQHRPLTQELVQMAMAKTAERVALIEESERQRGLPPTTKVASDETDESIGTDFAEKLASAVEFILPEVQAKEAAGVIDAVGGAVRRGAGALAEKGIDVGWNRGMGTVGKAMTAVGERAGKLTNKQLAGGAAALGGGALLGTGAVAGAGAHKALGSERQASFSDKEAAGRSRAHDKVKQAASLPPSFKANAEKVKNAVTDVATTAAPSGKSKARTAADAVKDALVKNKGKAVAAGVATGAGMAYGAKKVHEKATEKKAFVGAAIGGAIGGAEHGKKGRGALSAGAGGLVGAQLAGQGTARALRNSTARALASGDKKKILRNLAGTFAASTAGEIAGGIGGYHLGMKGHRKGDKPTEKKAFVLGGIGGAIAGSDHGKAGRGALGGAMGDKQEKNAEDAINPAHISGKASPLAAAPVRTETGQDGPPAQGNTGALSSNAAAIAFSNAKNQGMKAEQLRKYFSNAASSQHGDPALTKNFAHKTASDKVAEAQHILSALAAQVEGK